MDTSVWGSTPSSEAELDVEIEAVTRKLRELRSIRNAHFSRFNRLPPEIIITIFLQVQSESRQKLLRNLTQIRHTENGSVSGLFKWILLAHVCRFWRDIILDVPGFWSLVSVSFPLDRVHHFLQLSKQFPLWITPPTSPNIQLSYTPYYLAAILAQNMHRIQLLDIPVDEGVIEKLREHHCIEAPLLEVLRLDCDSSNGAPDWFMPGVHLPRLSTVHLRGLPFDFVVGSAQPALTSLHVSQVHEATSIAHWLLILQDCPLLKTLRITNGLHRTYVEDESNTPPVSLPRLRLLQLKENYANCIVVPKFLQYLLLPLTCTLLVDEELDEEYDTQGITSLCSSVTSQYSRMPAESFRSASMAFKDLSLNTALVLNLWNSGNDNPDVYATANGPNRDASLTLYWQQGDVAPWAVQECVMHAVGRGLASSVVEVLVIDDRLTSMIPWVPFGRWSQLRELTVYIGNAPSAFVAFFGAPVVADNSDTSSSAIVLPKLQSLSLRFTFTSSTDPSIHEQIEEALRLRWEAGVPLHTLKIFYPPVVPLRELFFDRLKKFVDVLIWP